MGGGLEVGGTRSKEDAKSEGHGVEGRRHMDG